MVTNSALYRSRSAASSAAAARGRLQAERGHLGHPRARRRDWRRRCRRRRRASDVESMSSLPAYTRDIAQLAQPVGLGEVRVGLLDGDDVLDLASSARDSGGRSTTQRQGCCRRSPAGWSRRRWRGNAPGRRAPAACCSTAPRPARRRRRALRPAGERDAVRACRWSRCRRPRCHDRVSRLDYRAEHLQLLGVGERRRLAGGAGDDEPVRAVGEQVPGERGELFVVDGLIPEGRHHGGEDGPEAPLMLPSVRLAGRAGVSPAGSRDRRRFPCTAHAPHRQQHAAMNDRATANRGAT